MNTLTQLGKSNLGFSAVFIPSAFNFDEYSYSLQK